MIAGVAIGWWILAAIVGYLLGSINPATLIAKARGIDIRAVGSGNPGATNAGRALGKKAGIIVLLLDLLKGLIPVLIFTAWVAPGVGALAGFAAILGHMTSPFLHFHGGKGVATTLGVLIGIEPWWLIPVLAVFIITFLIVRRTGIASVFASLALIITGILDNNDLETSLFAILIGALVIVKHQRNIRAAITDLTKKPSSTG